MTISPIVTAKAFAATLTVVGTVALTMATIASIYMICAGASGMDGAVRNQARATGTQPLDYMGQLLNRWLSATGVLPATLAAKFQQGFSYLPDGTLFLDNDCTEAVADFQRWAWDEDGANLEQFAVIGTSDGNLHGGGYTALVFDCSQGPVNFWNIDWYYDDTLVYSSASSSAYGNYIALSSQSGRCYVIVRYVSTGSTLCEVYVAVPRASGNVALALFNSSSTFGGISDVKSATGTWQLVTGFNHNSYPLGLTPQPYAGDIPSLSDMVGESAVIGDPDTFYGPAQQEQGTEIAAGSAVTVSPEAAANLHIANYLRAMAAAYAGTGVADVPVTDTGTGEDDTLPLSVPLDTPLTVTGISDSAIDQSGSTAVSDSVAADFTGLDDYTMDLTRFFPFCIPFDLAALFQKFEAEAAAPVVDIPFPNPAAPEGTPLSVHVDLTPFDELAAVVRKLELVAFVIGLCFLTKRLIQGGD